MPGRRRTTALLAVLALTSAPVSACTAGDASDPRAATTRSPASAAPAMSGSAAPTVLPALPRSDSGRTVARLENRTGPWKAGLGAAGDKGSLKITVTCVGGGSLAVAYHDASSRGGSYSPPCDGDTSAVQDDAVPAGPVDVAVTPDGDQHWSIDITRGAAED